MSAAPSTQHQWTQEVRYAARLSRQVNFVAGGFVFRQGLHSDPSFKQEQGSAAARFLLAPTAAAATPGLLDGYGFNQYVDLRQHQRRCLRPGGVAVADRLRLIPGLRFNYDQKDVDFDQQVYGGLQTTDPRADRAAALGARAAGVLGGCRRHQPLRTVDGRLSGSRRP